jgi:hypothetical protein
MNTKHLLLVVVSLGTVVSIHGALITTIGRAPVRVREGYVVGGGSSGGFLYNLTTRTRQLIPNTSGVGGVYDGIAVGSWGNQGFTFNVSTNEYTTILSPFGGQEFILADIYGNNIIGTSVNNSVASGFVFDRIEHSWSTLNYPGATGTSLRGIWENKIVGVASGIGGVMYDLNTQQWSLLPDIDPNGISGNNIAGRTSFGSRVYNLASGTYFNPLITATVPPGQLVTNWEVNDYSNGIAVGTYGYYDGRFNRSTGYIYVVPEASTFLLAGLGTVATFGWRWYRRMLIQSRN